MFKKIVRNALPVVVLASLMGFSNVTTFAHEEHRVSDIVNAIANGDHRSDEHKARNAFRHPGKTLEFFGLKKGITVVEISPGGSGWYAEILAPFLKGNGTYYAANYSKVGSDEPYYERNASALEKKLKADPKNFSEVEVSVFMKGSYDIAPAGSADLVLTFRNLHNWMMRDYHEESFKAFYKALKPGGTFGIIEHRADPDIDQDPKADSGYVREDLVIKMVEAAGFKFVGKSEVNANPKDNRNHPKGVWTLPPTYQLGDKDRTKYTAIGESDRMTLKFVKPE